MTMIALIMVPWVKLMRETGVNPRVLADDLMFTIVGKGRLERTCQAMTNSRQFFEDMGAKVAVKKCFTFAYDKHTRDLLTKMVWGEEGLRIPCVNSFRDLGTHMNCTQTPNGITLTLRMQTAIRMIKRLLWMPITYEMKIKIINTNIVEKVVLKCT